MFDIEEKIRDWKLNWADADSVSKENIQELEEHLRETVADLLRRGLCEKEAFMIASARLGDHFILEKEYRKVNATYVWRKRIMWMLCGYLGGSAFANAISGISTVAGSAAALVGFGGGPAGATATVATAVCWTVFLIALWFRTRRNDARAKGDYISLAWLTGFVALIVAGGGLEMIGNAVCIHGVLESEWVSFFLWTQYGTLAIRVCVFVACIGMIIAFRETPAKPTEITA